MARGQWQNITIFLLLLAAGISSVLALPSNSTSSLSGVGTDRTRYIYPEGTRQIGLTLKNKTLKNYLVQAWVRGIDPKTGNVINEQAPFFLKQPLVKAVADGRYGYQLIQTKPVPEQDRESIYLLSFRFIPPNKLDKSTGTAQADVVLTYNVKLFYRPAKLKDSKLAVTAASLKFSRQRSVLNVKNNGPLWITFYSLQVGTHTMSEEALRQMVSPFGEADYPLQETMSGNKMTWRVVDENGDVTKEYSTEL